MRRTGTRASVPSTPAHRPSTPSGPSAPKSCFPAREKRHSSFRDPLTREPPTLHTQQPANPVDREIVNSHQQPGETQLGNTSCTKDSAAPAASPLESPNTLCGDQLRPEITRPDRGQTSTSARAFVHSISTASLVSNTPSSPPSLSASTTPSSAISTLSALPESPTSPCPSESSYLSLLSNSTLSSPAQVSFPCIQSGSGATSRKAKMTSSTTVTTGTTENNNKRNNTHTRSTSNGSTSSAGGGGAGTAAEGSSLLLASSTGSNASTSNRRSGRKSATPSALNTQAANSSFSNSAGPPSSSNAPTSTSSSGKEKALSSALSGLLSPTSAQSLTSAQQSALERALAAGISRDEFEKTRASVVSMLRGQAAASSSSSASARTASKERSATPQPPPAITLDASANTATSADNSLLFGLGASETGQEDESAVQLTEPKTSSDGLPKLSISTASSARNTTNQAGSGSTRSAKTSGSSTTTSNGGSVSSSTASLLSASTSSRTGISEFGHSTAPSTAASTLRTSVSSSNTEEGHNHRESPATSEDGGDGDHAESKSMAVDDIVEQGEVEDHQSRRQQTPPKHKDATLSSSSSKPQEDVNMLSNSSLIMDRSKSLTGLDEDEEDSSFSAATAAAAALGMLASSPVKVVERGASSLTQFANNNNNSKTNTSTQIPFMNGASGMFSQHRSGGGFVSSSSPPLLQNGGNTHLANTLGQGLVPSSSSGALHLYSSPGARSPSSRSPSNMKNDSSGDLSAEGLVAAVALGEGSIASRGGLTAGLGESSRMSSTTPVRTRLEDIALKSSAQIRRQREILGLGEEEMMDLDTDARHENALLRGAFGDEDEDREHDDSAAVVAEDAPRRRQSSRRSVRATSRKTEPAASPSHEPDSESILLAGGLAPAFSYPNFSSTSSTSTNRKVSRSPSRPTSTNSSRESRSSRQTSRGMIVPPQHSPAKLGSPQLPSLSHQVAPLSSSSATASTSRRRAGHHHHRRLSSYGMSGMLDRFMESNYSPKASQIAKFEEAVRRASPERSSLGPVPSSSTASYDTDRTLTHHHQALSGNQDRQQGEEDDDEDVYYEEVDDDDDMRHREDVTIQSTPRTHMDKSRLLRSAGNDLPSPLLQQIRLLSDADHSPHSGAEGSHQERETPRISRGPAGYSARQELGLASGHGSSSEFGSARKRKASYDLQSPRHLVRNVHTSATPEEEEDEEEDQGTGRHSRVAAFPPPPFPNSERSQARFHERVSAGHPSSAGLFDGPTPSHSQSSSQSSAGNYRLSQSQPRSSHHAPRQAYAQAHHQYPHSQHQHSRHYIQEHQAPPPYYGIVAQQHPPSSAERQPPVHYQQHPGHGNGVDELSQYALAPPRPPSHGHLSQAMHSSHMSRPESVSSDYIPNQREVKKKEKAMKKAQGPLRRERNESVPSSTASGPAATASASTPGAPGVSTLDNFVPANVQVGQYDEKTKPPFSYAALIGQAIFSTPNRRMSLADIYTYIMTLYPFYRKQDAGWQNSIRHNLSLNECFVKTQRGPDEPGKGCLWSILAGTEEQFTGGNFYKKGKVPKSALKQGGSEGGEGGSSVAPSSHDESIKRKKANSVASATETMSVMSADDSYDTQSANSYSYASHDSSMMQSHAYPEQHPRQVRQFAQHPAYGHQGYPATYQQAALLPHGPSSLRQKQQLHYSDDVEQEDVYDEEDDSFDMDDPPARYSRPEQPQPSSAQQQQQQLPQHRPRLVVKQPTAVTAERLERAPKRESSPDGETEEMSRAPSDYGHSDVFDAGPEPAEQSFSNSDRSGSLEPAKKQQPIPHTSPVRRGLHDRQRALLTSPPIMSSPPTNVFARMSQPYQPLRTAFNLPSSSAHAEALMSSPPPSSGIMPSDLRMRRLPPPTPRRASADGEDHPGSHIFLPAPNIKPGKASFGKKTGEGEDVKPTLPPIHMMSPASALALNTQSPISSVRGSATQHRSSSPSPKSSSQASSSANSITRSPTLNKSKHLQSSEVFKTPDRFAAPSSRSISSPHKLAHLANNNASKALQSLQTPKLGTSRAGHGLVTPGGYYDPYEYGAVLDEELDRMMATNKEDGGRSDRRPLPFPSPVDRTPKWQPWSPW